FTTGLVYNSAHDIAGQPVEFPVSGPANDNSTTPPTPIKGGASGSAAFIFVTEDGCINAWRSNTKIAMATAPIIIDYSKTSHFPYRANCVFSGAAMTVNASTSAAYKKAGGNHLFATDFRNDKIVVFDNKWNNVTASYHFQTPSDIRARDLHVFNILDLAGHLYVAYAKFSTNSDEGMEEEDGLGSGYGHIVEYNEDGTLVRDFHDKGMLNAPWGMAIAPAKFGKFGGDLLVASLGDGTIAAFDSTTGNFVDRLRDQSGKIISIDRIWGLTFGNGVSLGDANALYFTAGPKNEYDGLFGKLTVAPSRPLASTK
ncbi:MAG TPA: TIGR03118 family protein, partial [Candidatus Methylacidiphilales bacterium]|nr:TIGR03118 family protein [Candidatus Methylacidiphilales bacterium]